MEKCFLCEEGECFLAAFDDGFRLYSSLFPDMDPNCEKPLHLLVAPKEHYTSAGMSFTEYAGLMLRARLVKEFFMQKGYGPAVTQLMLEPGPHTPHIHIHLVFSSNPLRPLRQREKTQVTKELLEKLKKESALFLLKTKPW